MDIDFLLKNIENHSVFITAIIFILSIILGIIGFFIKRWFFADGKNETNTINAKGNISAGGDIISGHKTTIINSTDRINLESFEKLIKESNWKKEIINNKDVYICESNNTYQIEIGEGRDFTEKWTQIYPDKFGSSLIPVYLKINNTVIKQLSFIYCDGGRIFVPLPKREEGDGKTIFYWVQESLAYKLAKIIGEYYIYNSIRSVAKRSNIKIK